MDKQYTKTFLCLSDKPNIASLTPTYYPWAVDIYNAMTNNLWLPTVVKMSEDIAAFKESSEDERNAYIRSLAYLTTADVTAMANINLAISSKISAVEIQAVYSHLLYQEANHSHSYL